MRAILIRLNNRITRLRRVRVGPQNLLLLIPHCLQRTQCDRNVTADVDRCARCGQCDVAAILDLRDRYGIMCHLASGGREALARVKRPDIKAVVAVACEAELSDGIRACFPKPVLAVVNARPNGPCRDTCVDISVVEAAVCSMLTESAVQAPPQSPHVA